MNLFVHVVSIVLHCKQIAPKENTFCLPHITHKTQHCAQFDNDFPTRYMIVLLHDRWNNEN